jgi:RNA polymerase sigma-70 factor (ECF subfamily)
VDESILIRQAQQGDLAAFEELVIAHQRFVYNLALRAVCDSQEAEDIAQEAFLRAWRGLGEFRGQAQFRTWLYRIVVNLCYNRLPGLKRSIAEIPTDEDQAENVIEPGPSFQENLENQEQRKQLKRALAGLPESYRVMILLRYQQDMPYEEIAEVLSVPVGTVKTGIFRAKERLRQALRLLEVAV